MKNIIEVVKENKSVILKRGLIGIGAIAGLTVVGRVLMAKTSQADDEEAIEANENDESNEDSEEE